MSLYHKTVQSGILLEGTWQGDGIIIKIDGKTAEFYRSGAAEAAVLNIYGDIGDRTVFLFDETDAGYIDSFLFKAIDDVIADFIISDVGDDGGF